MCLITAAGLYEIVDVNDTLFRMIVVLCATVMFWLSKYDSMNVAAVMIDAAVFCLENYSLRLAQIVLRVDCASSRMRNVSQ